MLQLKHCQTDGTESSGAVTNLQGLFHLIVGGGHGTVVKFMLVSELANEGSGYWAVSVGSGPGKPLHEFCCNSTFVSQALASEGYGLNWVRVGTLPREALKKSQ